MSLLLVLVYYSGGSGLFTLSEISDSLMGLSLHSPS